MGRLYAFEAAGTLFDDASVVRRLAARLGPDAEALARAWRLELRHQAWARALMGAYRSLSSLAEPALGAAIASLSDVAHRVATDPSLRDALLVGARRPDPFPEARDVLAALRARGDEIAILSDDAPTWLEDAVAASGLGGLVDAVVSADEVDTTKPHPRAYRALFERFDRACEDVTFVAAQRWDVAGAVAFGLVGAWIDRAGEADWFPDLPAAIVGRDLRALL